VFLSHKRHVETVFSTGSLKWNRITDETDRITDRIADKTDRITDENDRVIHAMFVAEFRDKQICDRVGSCRLMRFMWQNHLAPRFRIDGSVQPRSFIV